MAPANTPSRKKRENQYFDVGVQGRKTGITLPENARDEYGIEDMDGIFSSPEKPPARRSAHNGNKTLTSSDMEVAQSSIPEPEGVLTGRRLLRSTHTEFPPPPGRSPFKTNIGSSPRRQSSAAPAQRGIGSSPVRAKSQVTSHSVIRRLNFTADEPLKSIEQSPLRASVRHALRKSSTPADVYELRPTPPSARGLKRTYGQSIEEEMEVELQEPYMNGAHDDSLLMVGGEYDPEVLNDTYPYDNVAENTMTNIGQDETVELPHSSPIVQRKGRGKPAKNKSNLTNGSSEPLKKGGKSRQNRDSVVSVASVASELPKKKGKAAKGNLTNGSKRNAPAIPPQKNARSRPRKSESIIEDNDHNLDPSLRDTVYDESTADETSQHFAPPTSMLPPPRPKPQARKPQRSKLNIHQEVSGSEEPEVARLVKRAKNSSKAGPSERDPNILMRSQSQTSDDNMKKKSLWNKAGRAMPRTLQILRQESVMNGSNLVTRSGRRSVKPIAYWHGEQIERAYDGTMLNIVRAESVEVETKPTKRGKRKVQPMPALAEEEEHGGLELEQWEADGQTINGLVREWDSEYGVAMEDEEVETEIAFSANSLETREVDGATFQFAKILSLPFFGGGIVDIQPYGQKRPKNTRRMHMIFFVAYGKVRVTVADVVFDISTGGVWQVPRGNNYEIENNEPVPARVFFAQGCELDAKGD